MKILASKNKKTMKTSKGFTIIELLVVIAIIAVLAAVVLVNVSQYISKGKDAAIKGNMASIATIAAAVYDNNTSVYTGTAGLAASAAYTAGIAAIDDANGATGTVLDEIIDAAYCVESTLNAGGSWCVDSTGYKGSTAECDAATADCAADT